MHNTIVEDWGLIDYEEAQARQLKKVSTVQEYPQTSFLIFCTHPPVVTLGRKSQEEDIFAWQGPTLEVQRGGRATYHGPNQLVSYPIINLTTEHEGFRLRDINAYLRFLESCLVEVVASYDVKVQTKPSEEFMSLYKDVEMTGIWYGDRKLASIGIGVKKWVTFHGLAINLDRDEKAFAGMNPCGFKNDVVISLEEILSRGVDREEFKAKLIEVMKRGV